MSEPREWYILQHHGDCFIYDSRDEFPPDGDESLLIHVREVMPESKQLAISDKFRNGVACGLLVGTFLATIGWISFFYVVRW